MTSKIIKLTKEETNELLKVISSEEPNYGLILKLQYLYGRNISEVYQLKKQDVDKDHHVVSFYMNGDKLNYPVHPEIKDDLYEVVDEAKKEYVFQEGDRPLATIKDGINYYLHRKSDGLTKLPFLEGLRLTTKDFKALRGQHLFEEGVSIRTIHELYHNTNTDGTKKTICYEELKEELYPEDIDTIILDTRLSIYSDHSFNTNPIFYVTNRDGDEAILEIKGECMDFFGEFKLKSKFHTFESSVLRSLLDDVTAPGDYIYYEGLKFLRN